MKLLVSITIFGTASEYIKDDLVSVPDPSTAVPNPATERAGSNDKILKPSWSFEPSNSVQDIYGGFSSSTKIFTSRPTSKVE